MLTKIHEILLSNTHKIFYRSHGAKNKFTADICYLYAPFFCILALEPGLGHLQMLSQH